MNSSGRRGNSHARNASLGDVLPALGEMFLDKAPTSTSATSTNKASTTTATTSSTSTKDGSTTSTTTKTTTTILTKGILVTSGSGVIGYRVAMSLLEAGYAPEKVRVGIYNSSQDRADEGCALQCAQALREKGAEVVDFDWTNCEDFDAALRGVSLVVCTIPHIQGWQDVFPKFVRKCMYKNVQHFVKISCLKPITGSTTSSGSGSPTNNASNNITTNNKTTAHLPNTLSQLAQLYRERVPYCSFHGQVDDYLMSVARQNNNGHPMTYTILGCSHLMTEPLFVQGKFLRQPPHVFATASYGMGVNYVSPNDVADAALVVILQSQQDDPVVAQQHRHQIYNITGPGPTTDAHVASLLSQALGGVDVQHLSLGYNEYVQHLTQQLHLPAWHVQHCAAMERMKATGAEELATSYTRDYYRLTGKEPQSFRDFLLSKTHPTCMRPGMAFGPKETERDMEEKKE